MLVSDTQQTTRAEAEKFKSMILEGLQSVRSELTEEQQVGYQHCWL